MINISNICGSCNGTTRTLNLIYDIYEKELEKENPKNIYLYKDTINNPTIIQEFKNLGINIIDDLNELCSDDIIIINGESKEIYEYLNKNNIEYYDGTCSKINKIQKAIEKKYSEGYEIIIVGSKSNSLVINLNGWCDNKGIIIENESDIENISNNSKKYIVGEVTIKKDTLESIVSLVKEKFNDCEIETYNTYCREIEKICESSKKIAKESDVMFIIGEKSKDTEDIINEVSNIVASYNFSDLKSFSRFILESNITGNHRIGITAGIKTPIKEIYNYKYLLSFLLFYKEKLQELKNSQHEINKNINNNDNNEILNNVINDFVDLNQDGKYIRGVLIALGEYFANPKSNLYLHLAYAYEMFQTSLLIHDDIIDNAKIRRGKETIPRRICKNYLNNSNNKDYNQDVLKLANSIAICSGDLGFYEANKIIIQNYNSHPSFSKLLDFYNDIVIKTIKGEIIDVYLPFLSKHNIKNTSEQDIFDIYHLKTSWYTIIGPFTLGYILGGNDINNELLEILNKIGLAFQVKDDILGVFGDSNIIGKSNTSDIIEFKQTILYSHIINTSYGKEFLKIYGNKNITEKDLLRVRELLISSGSYEYAINYLDDLYKDTMLQIDELEENDDCKDILKGLLIFMNIREK